MVLRRKQHLITSHHISSDPPTHPTHQPVFALAATKPVRSRTRLPPAAGHVSRPQPDTSLCLCRSRWRCRPVNCIRPRRPVPRALSVTALSPRPASPRRAGRHVRTRAVAAPVWQSRRTRTVPAPVWQSRAPRLASPRRPTRAHARCGGARAAVTCARALWRRPCGRHVRTRAVAAPVWQSRAHARCGGARVAVTCARPGLFAARVSTSISGGDLSM